MYQGVYNKSYGIDVPPGNHTIRIENDGRDWIKITMYKFDNSDINTNNKIVVMGVLHNNKIFLWLRNEKYQWQQLKQEKVQQLPEITSILKIPALAIGTYQLEWWDTYQGKIFQREVVLVNQNDEIKLNIPAFNKDIACKIYRKNSK